MIDPVSIGPDGIPRCTWANASASLRKYHDQDWGVPVHDDVALFGKLILARDPGQAAGLPGGV